MFSRILLDERVSRESHGIRLSHSPATVLSGGHFIINSSSYRARNNGWRVAGQGDRPTQFYLGHTEFLAGQIIHLNLKSKA
jgi:hypothetical protein